MHNDQGGLKFGLLYYIFLIKSILIFGGKRKVFFFFFKITINDNNIVNLRLSMFTIETNSTTFRNDFGYIYIYIIYKNHMKLNKTIFIFLFIYFNSYSTVYCNSQFIIFYKNL